MSILEEVSLKWGGFEVNVVSTFARFRNVSDFSDVTLVCEDGMQVEAHKVILASSSTFFMNILKKNHPNPVIFMRGLNLAELMAVVDFLYFGEAKVLQENLDNFLVLAQDLGLEGLTGNEKSDEGELDVEKLSTTQKRGLGVKEESNQSRSGQKHQSDVKISKESFKEEAYQKKTGENGDITTPDAQSVDKMIKSMMEIGETMTEGSQKGKRTRICKECGKEGTMSCIMNHIEVSHLPLFLLSVYFSPVLCCLFY